MAERQGLGVIPGAGWRAAEISAVAREAEEAGFDAIVAAEVNNDVLATAQLMGAATQRIKVGTWVANIYLRNSYVCAQSAALIADATGGRMVLGLGVSHQPVNQALGVEMPSPITALRQYTIEVSGWLRGDGPATHLPQRASPHPVPIYLGALTSATVELAGEVADGIMPIWWSPERVARSKVWIERGRAKSPGRAQTDIALGLPTFIGEDIEALREAACANLGLFPNLPFFQRLLRASGFAAEADLAEQGAAVVR
jgi:alkanesulfonate monooxygenase SsuD/methylene tetrahydromethanopterin reductase-like flavin-dependent oxidoreductase (luciferase family)